MSVAIAISVADPRWKAALPGAVRLARRAARMALAAAAPEMREGEVSLLLADDARISELNRRYRRRRGPTNVLSFPSEAPLLGDVAIAYETTAREATAEGKPLGDHLAHLVVHGVLHLLGHDHMGVREALRMESLEVAALFRLGIADPYNGGGQ